MSDPRSGQGVAARLRNGGTVHGLMTKILGPVIVELRPLSASALIAEGSTGLSAELGVQEGALGSSREEDPKDSKIRASSGEKKEVRQ